MADAAGTPLNVYVGLGQVIDKGINLYVAKAAATVAAAAAPILASCCVLYLMLYTLAALRGAINEPYMDGVGRFFKICSVCLVAGSTGLYVSEIVQLIMAFPEWLMLQMSGGIADGTTGGTLGRLDSVLDKGLDIGGAFWEHAELTAPGGFLMAALTWTIFIISTLIAGSSIVVAKFGLAAMVAIGPFMIVGIMFEPTKSLFTGWVSQVLNFAIVPALTTAVVGIIFAALDATAQQTLNQVSANAGSDTLMGIRTIISVVILGLVGFAVLLQVPQWASGLTGGISMSAERIVSAAQGAASSAAKSFAPPSKGNGQGMGATNGGLGFRAGAGLLRGANALRPSKIGDTARSMNSRAGAAASAVRNGINADVRALKRTFGGGRNSVRKTGS